MPKGKVKKGGNYYDEDTELAVIEYLNTEDHVKRSKIWNEHLDRPFRTLVEAIINTYRNRRTDIDFSEQHADVLGELICKFPKFNNSLGHKSYSYFGTIARNQAMNDKKKADERTKKVLDFDIFLPDLMTKPELTYELDDKEIDKEKLFSDITEAMKLEVAKPDLTEHEFKVGTAIIHIFQNWEILFDFDETVKNSNNFNKNNALRILRDLTMLDTKSLRKALKRFKVFYEMTKMELMDAQLESEDDDIEENPYIDNDFLS